MRRFFRVLLAGALTAAALTATAAAADFTHCADSLKAMGLFQGTNQGYELDRAPTRAEAAAMLVRLLGRESEAQATAYAAPFTDVPAWAKPYVGWLYANGLTQGVSTTKYDPQSACTAQMYATFLLRALGYTEQAGDFTYAGALDFARTQGVADTANCDPADFERDHVAAMSYTALSRPVKGSADTLLDTLIAGGAVSRSQAAETAALFDRYEAYAAASAKTDAQGSRSSETATDIVVNQGGQTVAEQQTRTTSAAVGQKLASQTTENGVVRSAFYYDGSVLYRLENGKTTRQEMSFAQALAGMGGQGTLPISLMRSLTAQVGATSTTYEAVCAPAAVSSYVARAGQTLGLDAFLNQAFSVDKMSWTFTVNDAGLLSRRMVEVGYTANWNSQRAGITVRMDSYLTGTGDQVSLWVPEGLEIG